MYIKSQGLPNSFICGDVPASEEGIHLNPYCSFFLHHKCCYVTSLVNIFTHNSLTWLRHSTPYGCALKILQEAIVRNDLFVVNLYNLLLTSNFDFCGVTSIFWDASLIQWISILGYFLVHFLSFRQTDFEFSCPRGPQIICKLMILNNSLSSSGCGSSAEMIRSTLLGLIFFLHQISVCVWGSQVHSALKMPPSLGSSYSSFFCFWWNTQASMSCLTFSSSRCLISSHVGVACECYLDSQTSLHMSLHPVSFFPCTFDCQWTRRQDDGLCNVFGIHAIGILPGLGYQNCINQSMIALIWLGKKIGKNVRNFCSKLTACGEMKIGKYFVDGYDPTTRTI